MEGGDSLAVDLVRRDLEHEASKRYKRFVIRSRLKRVPNESVKCNMFVRRKRKGFLIGKSSPSSPQMGTYSGPAVRYVKPSGCIFMIVLPTYLITRIRSFAGILPTSPAFRRRKQLFTKGWLQSVKSAGMDGLRYEVYLMSPIRTNVFNYCFATGAIRSTFTKRMITLLKKGGNHV